MTDHFKTATTQQAAVGYAETSEALFQDVATENNWIALQKEALNLKADPNMGLPNFRRGFGRYLLYNDLIISLPGLALSAGGLEATVASFDIGDANRETPSARVFGQLGSAFDTNPAFRQMLRLSRDLDTADPRAKEGVVAVQVFIQAAMVTDEEPTIQAAPPDKPHNDECRFKANFLVGKFNVEGGETLFLPRNHANKPFREGLRKDVLHRVMLDRPDQGYCFLDEEATPGEVRENNCHYAAGLTKGPLPGDGFRIVGTFTPTPLLPSSGSKGAVEHALEHFRANTTALHLVPEIINALGAERRAEIVTTLTT